MSRRTRYFLFISCVALAAFIMAAYATIHPRDWPFDHDRSFRGVRNLSGPLGSLLAYVFIGLLGRLLAWAFPVGLLVLGGGLVSGRGVAAVRILLKSFVVIVLLTSFFSLLPVTSGSALVTGSLGATIAGMVSSVLGQFGGTIVLITVLLLVLFGELRQVAGASASVFGKTPLSREKVFGWFESLAESVDRTVVSIQERREQRREAREKAREEAALAVHRRQEGASTHIPEAAPWIEVDQPSPPEPRAERATPPKRAAATIRPLAEKPASRVPAATPKAPVGQGVPVEKATLPPLSILKGDPDGRAGYSTDQLKSWSDVLVAKLSNYGIEGRITAVNQGPLVTTFEFEPAPGVKVKDIVSRTDDLALAMRAKSLRLIAPIPGRAVVGIEIPNPDQHVVYFLDVLKEIPERLRYSGIMIALGVDAIGKPFQMNLCGAPHLLMAGTTGSGKSVALNGFLASILFQYRPSDVKLLIIDPKMVEMSMFNGIPHLLHPVITDPREAVRIFNYLITEMERRNRILQKAGVKNIESYNSKVALGKMDSETDEKMPYIVLVVDELADLVLTKGIDFESLLSRLSNMARAVGIHMIVATQRPSVDVIDGKTKANFPTRIAFRVASKVDSRTILDCMGAEKLLGRGDMLFVDAKHPEAIRLHGAWLAEQELEELVAHWKQFEFDEEYLQLIEETRETASSETRDPLFNDAREVVQRFKQGSTSLLQRKLHVGYARAARLLDQLEDAGFVGPPDGSKPREVLIENEEELRSDV